MNKTALILGASGGIGAELARTLAGRDWRPHLFARRPEPLATLAEEIGAGFTAGDVADDSALATAVEAAGGQDGLHALAYCVGSIVMKPFARSGDEDFLDAFRINLLGAARALRAAEAPLKRSGGAALLFSSVAVQQGFANHSVIAAAKGAVEGLTRAIAAEWAPKARVNCIAPSLTRTPLSSALLQNEKIAAALAQAHPLGRLGEPSDAAALGAFLLSPGAGWISGEVIALDGGRSRLRTRG